MIASSRLRNSGVKSLSMASLSSPSRTLRPKPIAALARSDAAGIGRHDDDDIAEIDLLAAVVGQLAVIHDLEQHVEDVGMRLLDLVEQQHHMRVLVHRIRQQPALVEADIAGRRPDQPRNAVALHVFRHVEAHELDPEAARQLAGGLRLADARRAGEQVAADGLLRLAQAGPGRA